MIAIFHADFQGASHGIHNIQPGAFSSGDGMSIVFFASHCHCENYIKLPECVFSLKQKTMGMEIVVTFHTAGHQNN